MVRQVRVRGAHAAKTALVNRVKAVDVIRPKHNPSSARVYGHPEGLDKRLNILRVGYLNITVLGILKRADHENRIDHTERLASFA